MATVNGIELKPGTYTIKDCFIMPKVWDEDGKRLFTEWLSRQPHTHPAKDDPEPWR